jgi:hypothetical protein
MSPDESGAKGKCSDGLCTGNGTVSSVCKCPREWGKCFENATGPVDKIGVLEQV